MRRRRKPIPAALAPGVVEALAPLDELRLRLVADDPEVRDALIVLADAAGRVHRALDVARAAPGDVAAARAHVAAVRAYQPIVHEVEQAVERAEVRREQRIAATPPDHAALAAKVVRRVDADVLLAVETVLRRKPHWRDAALWTAPETVRYLARTLVSEVKLDARRERVALSQEAAARHDSESRRRERNGRGIRGRTAGSPTERTVQHREAVARRSQRLDDLLDRFNAPPALRDALALVVENDLPVAEALRQAGVAQGVYDAWVNRAQRGTRRAPSDKEFASLASKKGGRSDG